MKTTAAGRKRHVSFFSVIRLYSGLDGTSLMDLVTPSLSARGNWIPWQIWGQKAHPFAGYDFLEPPRVFVFFYPGDVTLRLSGDHVRIRHVEELVGRQAQKTPKKCGLKRDFPWYSLRNCHDSWILGLTVRGPLREKTNQFKTCVTIPFFSVWASEKPRWLKSHEIVISAITQLLNYETPHQDPCCQITMNDPCSNMESVSTRCFFIIIPPQGSHLVFKPAISKTEFLEQSCFSLSFQM